MNPPPTAPCTPHFTRPTRRRCAGASTLEFALALIVACVVAAFALERIAQLQVSAGDAKAQTTEAQRRSAAALAEARDALPANPAASPPCAATPFTPTSAPRAGAVPGPEFPSCP